jgi:hypothetical protein
LSITLRVSHRAVEVDLVQAQVAGLGGAQPVPEGHEDHGRVPVTVAGRARFSDRDLAADFDNLIARQVEIIRHVGGVALHEGEQLLLPAREAPAVLALGHRLVSHEIRHVGVRLLVRYRKLAADQTSRAPVVITSPAPVRSWPQTVQRCAIDTVR